MIHNTESLVYDEADWIREGTDLAALGYPADRGWLNTFLENLLNTISRTVTRVSARHHLYNVLVLQPCQHDAATFPPMIIQSPISSFQRFPQTSSEVLCLISVNRRSSAPMSRKSRPEMKPFTWSLWTASTTSSAPSSLYWQQFYYLSLFSCYSNCNQLINQKLSGRVLTRSLLYSSSRYFSPPPARFLHRLKGRKFSLQRQHTPQYSWSFSATHQIYI